MSAQGKVWGTTDAIFTGQYFSVHVIKIDQGGFCSQHYHKRKLNHFHVLSGKVQIHEWPGEQDQPDTTELQAGQTYTVKAGVWHSFTAITPCTMLEIYEAAPIEEDIYRRSQGGNINAIKPGEEKLEEDQ